MGNVIFNKILEEKIEFFKFAFQQTSKDIFFDEDSKKLIHPGEFGTYREAICKDFLRFFIPMRLDISTGFLIVDSGNVSKQCDLIVYDRNNTPLIENAERQRFFPVETVCAIGEIKSDLSKNNFKEALNKLARNKRIKEGMSHPTVLKRDHPGKFTPNVYPYDNIFSFLICNKLDFKLDNICDEIDSLYEDDILQNQKHNLILSINDGVLLYRDDNDKSMMYSHMGLKPLKNSFITPDKNVNCHFFYACSYIFMGTTSASIYYPEISDYIGDSFSGGLQFNQTK
ncbi:DUF6602 domain-containing protein [Flavobacterium pallidum]|uniref:DUF6602 domain-containing protein n=1 Tax=Flavobacterium pallidum TaxID=2172098 RepID=A0A2S1SKH2_9FLAO|nr:DUF6602 domain-containing protein [Flavobacterium pallidum]AWI26862.1 hypothetical protein HYN49_13655 [Flavobacterium pallidum]